MFLYESIRLHYFKICYFITKLTTTYLINFNTGRGDRMKQAKADAQELIDRYRAEKQVEFDKSAGTGGTSGFSSELQTETENKVSMMQAQFQENQAKAVEIMLSKCCEVDCSVPVARVRSTQKLYGQ